MTNSERRLLPKLSGLGFALRCEAIWLRSLRLALYATALGVNAYVRVVESGHKIPQPILSGISNLSTVLLPVPIPLGANKVPAPSPSWACDRCNGPKTSVYTPTCDECQYEDLAKQMMREFEHWLNTGEIPDKVSPASLPRPSKNGPPPGRWTTPDPESD